MKPILYFIGWGVLLSVAGTACGYALQRSQNLEFEKKGIRTIFVAPLVNNSYKVGAENLVYNALVKKVSALRGVRVVQYKKDADAILRGTVDQAAYSGGGGTPASNLFGNDKLPPERRGSSDIVVATEYSSTLSCSFSLVRHQPRPANVEVLWSGSFSQNRTFPATNQIDVFGTTSALINESEFDRALRDMAESMSGDLYESMFVMF